jgi:diguanylate cyclase (GGDEF)-like protein
VAVALLDLDRFKLINDTYGHLTGDQVLKEVSRTIGAVLRPYDLAGRFGGEEFAVLLPQTRAPDAFRIAERIRASVADLAIIAPGASGGERLTITVSIGVAALDKGDRREFAELLAAADAALYRAKGSGRDQVQMLSTTRGLSAIGGSSPAFAARQSPGSPVVYGPLPASASASAHAASASAQAASGPAASAHAASGHAASGHAASASAQVASGPHATQPASGPQSAKPPVTAGPPSARQASSR